MLFLGLDLSTQQIKAIATDENLQAKATYSVEFDVDFKQKYGVTKGVLDHGHGEIVSPVLMWLDALDLLFERMKMDGFDFADVVGISGSCQQHGLVYWKGEEMEKLNSRTSLSEQLKNAFSYDFSPNWQDHSTQKELDEFEKSVGGASKLAEITGSRAHFRFTGLQIRKIVRNGTEAYKNTNRISLVSSFLESIFLGKYANIEQGEACGMNLYDIQKEDYDEGLLSVAADSTEKADIERLRKKLGPVLPISYESTGTIANYFSKYGFKSTTRVYSFTGDNLATISSLPLAPNDCLISLGTSTTVLIVTSNYKPSPQYHLFKHPTIKDHYMGMICYCNGSLAREKVRDSINEKYDLEKNSWDKFNEILDESKGFEGKLGVYFPLGEIVPSVKAQTKRYTLENEKPKEVKDWPIESDVASIVESQTLSCRLRSGPMLTSTTSDLHDIYDKLTTDGPITTDGVEQTYQSITSRPRRCFFVGGALNNPSIVSKMGSILSPLEGSYKVDIPNACALGGAYKASWSLKCENEGLISYHTYVQGLFELMKKLDLEDKWEEYFDGLGMLSKIEVDLTKATIEIDE